jgi:hypothetical protein
MIRGATVVGGLGHDPRRCAVRSGRTAAIGGVGKADLLLFALSRRTRTKAGEMRVAC